MKKSLRDKMDRLKELGKSDTEDGKDARRRFNRLLGILYDDPNVYVRERIM